MWPLFSFPVSTLYQPLNEVTSFWLTSLMRETAAETLTFLPAMDTLREFLPKAEVLSKGGLPVRPD